MKSDQENKREPYFRMEINAVQASLNRLFSMGPWGRLREKRRIQAAFLSGLSLIASDQPTLIITTANTSSTVSDIVDCFVTTVKKISCSKSVRRKSKAKKRRL